MTDDGRHIDPRLGVLGGEAAGQRGEVSASTDEVWGGLPTESHSGGTYYDRPILKEPVWIWTVPAYFYAGGAAGVASVLAAIADATGRDRLPNLIARCRTIAATGTAAGALLLIADLGRPARFLNMLRVFRPTSALNVGSWVLAGAGTATGAAAFGPKKTRRLAGLLAGALGFPLSGYTAVLLADTSVPVWRATERTLPFLFVAASASSACSLLDLSDLNETERRVVARLGLAARVAEVAAAEAVERDAHDVERVGRSLRSGFAGTLWTVAKRLSLASLLFALRPRSDVARRSSAVLGTAASITLRFAIYHAGKASARDPRAAFDQQRAQETIRPAPE